MDDLGLGRKHKVTALVLLAIAFGAGLVTLYKGEFSDEADNLVLGVLIRQGYVLYRDAFSHHFPFPYYWVAAVTTLLGKSIFIARFSVLAFQLVAFATGMKFSGNYRLVGVAAILWSIVRSFYRGNMVLYNAFAGAALALIFITIVAILRQSTRPGWKYWLTIALASVVAVLSDPLSVYAVAVAWAFLVTKELWGGMLVLLIVSVIGLLYVGYLTVSGSLDAFWNDAIIFNSQIYARYCYADPLRLKRLYHMVSRGLEISNRVWFNLDPLKPISEQYTELDRWFFTGFVYRLSIIGTALLFALRKEFRVAAFVYIFAAATLVIEKWDFRGQPFVMLSMITVAALMTREWWPDQDRLIRYTRDALSLIVSVTVLWLCGRLAVNIYVFRDDYGAILAVLEQRAVKIRELACGQPGVALAHYPGGTYSYWFTGMKPVAGYVFMWPWVAEVGLDAVLDELSQGRALAVVARENFLVWDRFDTRVYLRSLDEFLEAHYHKVAEGLYVSPELYKRCHEASEEELLQMKETNIELVDGVELAGYGTNVTGNRLFPGEWISLSLYWRAIGVPDASQNPQIAAEIVDKDGSVISRSEQVWLMPDVPSRLWDAGVIYVTRVSVRVPTEDLPEKLYLTLTTFLSGARSDTGRRLYLETFLTTGETIAIDPADAPHNRGEIFGGVLKLLGYRISANAVKPGDTLAINLFWEVLKKPPADYTVFIHLLNANGELVTQFDRPAGGVAAPTSTWQVDQVLCDTYPLSVPQDVSAGSYTIRVGMYLWPSMKRLSVSRGGTPAGTDFVDLGVIEITR